MTLIPKADRLTFRHACAIGIISLLLCPATVDAAPETTTPSAPFTSADVFGLKGVTDVQISPDGRSIAYLGTDTDIMIDGRRTTIRIIDIASGRERLLAADASMPRWSPDGRSIAYAGRGESGSTQLIIADATGDARRVVADLPSSASAIVWSPDGQTMALVIFVATPTPVPSSPVEQPAGAKWAGAPRIITSVHYQRDGQTKVEPGRMQIFTVAVAGGAPAQRTSGDADIEGDPVWTADGAGLIIGARNGAELARSYQTARLFLVRAAGTAQTALSPAALGARAPAVAPDGSRIAFIGVAQDGRDYTPSGLYVMNVDGTGLCRLDGTFDRELDSPTWSADGRSIYVGYGDHGNGKVARFDLAGHRTVVASGIVGDYTVSRAGVVAFAGGRPDSPADVVLATRQGKQRRLTNRNAALLAGKSLGKIRPLAVRSSLDGQAVGTWLTLPPGFRAGRRYPTIMVIHGGPYGYDGPIWSTTDQLYAAAGYVVLHANYRGSTSYGFAFADRIARDFPGPAYTDLMSAIDAAVTAGVADPSRLFITGGSAGGLLTAWTVGSTDRFRAAMAEKPVINAVSKALTTDQYVGSAATFGAEAWEAPERYWTSSPLSRVAKVNTPTMLVVGEEDRRTPVSESQQFYNALTLRGIPTALVVVPGASHSTIGSKPSQLIADVDITLD